MTAALIGLLAVLLAAASLAAGTWHRGRRRAEQDRDRLAAQLDRRLAELFSLQELSYVLSESLQLEHVADQVTRYVMRFLDAEGAALVLSRTDEGSLRVVAAAGSLADLHGHPVADDDAGLVLLAIGSERVQLLAPDAPDPLPLVADQVVPGVAVAPLRAHGVTVGALVVAGSKHGTFGVEDVRFLSTVATHTAVVLANARFFDLIRRSKEEWETAFDALAEGLAVVDTTNGTIRRANRALAEIAGLPIPGIIGKTIEAVLHSPSEALTRALEAAGGGERPAPVVLRVQPLRRTLRITTAPMADPASPRGAVVLVEDVTEQQALEAQLIQNEKLAAVGQLVSGVAHELNNPLTSIAGLAELLLEQPATPESAAAHLRVIHEQAERAGRIVQSLLTFARKGPVEVTRVSLNDIVRRTILLTQQDIQRRGIRLERRLAPQLPDVLGDRHQLQQVVMNLLTNAVQAASLAPAGRPQRVVVETEGSSGSAALRVCDTGPGIPDEIVDHIFTPFFTTKEPGMGTGLGLSISYQIAATHGGTVTLDRAEGETVFTLILPAAPPASEPTASDPKQVPAGHRSGRRILVIDDDPGTRRLARAFFAREGHDVDAVIASEGLGAVAAAPYDLIIVDARAATASGEPLLAALLAAHPDARDRLVAAAEAGRARGADYLGGLPCVRKPLTPRELQAVAQQTWGGGP